MSTIDLSDVQDALNMTAGANAELQRMLDQAEATYARHVRPLPGEQTTYLSGAGVTLWLPTGATEVTAFEYTDGTVVDVADLRVDEDGKVSWRYGTAGRFACGTDNIVVTYTMGDLPVDHVGVIIDDVAELWTRTQRAGGGGRPSFNADGFDEAAGRPVVRFPRIQALALPAFA